MIEFLVFLFVYIYTSVVWVFVLVVYNFMIESFDFGPLVSFAWKSAILILLVALTIMFVPLGGLAALVVWAMGLVMILKKDFWEIRVLLMLIWGSNFVIGFLMNMVLQAFLKGEPLP